MEMKMTESCETCRGAEYTVTAFLDVPKWNEEPTGRPPQVLRDWKCPVCGRVFGIPPSSAEKPL